jgi:hypothetical protein
MPKKVSKEIRIRIIFILFTKYLDNSLIISSLGVIKEENLWFCNCV